jgi:hypothetical protein
MHESRLRRSAGRTVLFMVEWEALEKWRFRGNRDDFEDFGGKANQNCYDQNQIEVTDRERKMLSPWFPVPVDT